MVSYSEETGTTYRNWQGSGFRKCDATIEVIVAAKFSAADMQKLIQVMSRLHENFIGNPLAIENARIRLEC